MHTHPVVSLCWAFGGGVGIAIVVGGLRTLAVADVDVDSLRGARGNVVVDIGVVAGGS